MNWIKTEDELPGEGAEVIFGGCTPNGYCWRTSGYYENGSFYEKNWVLGVADMKFSHVDFWVELPDLPEN